MAEGNLMPKEEEVEMRSRPPVGISTAAGGTHVLSSSDITHGLEILHINIESISHGAG